MTKVLDSAHYYRLGWLRSFDKKIPRGGWQLRAFLAGHLRRGDFELETEKVFPIKGPPCRHSNSDRWECPCPRCYYHLNNFVRTITDRPEIDLCTCETCEATR